MKIEIYPIKPLEILVDDFGEVESFVIITASEMGIKHDIYMELYEEEAFREYFTHAKEKILNPLTGECKLMRGFHNAVAKHGKKRHDIVIIYQPGWTKTIIHELTHAEDAERIGFKKWNKLFKLYKENRGSDPFEMKAYWREEHEAYSGCDD